MLSARAQQKLSSVGTRPGAAEEMRSDLVRPWLELELDATRSMGYVLLWDASLPSRGIPLSTFASLFKCNRVWWWDPFDALRRVLLNAALLFLQGSAVQVLLGLLIQMAAAVVAMRARPYTIGWCDHINVLSQWALFFLYLFVLLQKVDVASDSPSAEAGSECTGRASGVSIGAAPPIIMRSLWV